MITILIVDQQRIFGEDVKRLVEIEEDMNVSAILTEEEDMITYFKSDTSDMMIVDIHQLSTQGFKMIKHLKENVPELKVIYLTADIDRERMMSSIAAGANGILLKEFKKQSFIDLIRSIYAGYAVMSGQVAEFLADEIVELSYDKKAILNEQLVMRDMTLTDRELEVALLLINGDTNLQIAEELSVTMGTTKNYVSSIYDKVNLRDRKHLSAYLLGLISRH